MSGGLTSSGTTRSLYAPVSFPSRTSLVAKRRRSVFSHIARLSETVPANQALLCIVRIINHYCLTFAVRMVAEHRPLVACCTFAYCRLHLLFALLCATECLNKQALCAIRLEAMSDGVNTSTLAVQQVRDAVLRLNGMVGEASTLAAQLALARRRRVLCVDRHRRRQLPSLPADDRRPTAKNNASTKDTSTGSTSTTSLSTVVLRRLPTTALEESQNTASQFTVAETSIVGSSNSTVDKEFTTAACTETSGSSGSVGPVVACRNRSTSTTSDLAGVASQREVMDTRDSQRARRLTQVHVSDTDADRRRENAREQNHRDDELSIQSSVDDDENRPRPPVTTSTAPAATSQNPPRYSFTAAPIRKLHAAAISCLLRIATAKPAFRRFADSLLRLHHVISGLDRIEGRSKISNFRQVPSSHVVSIILMAAVCFCLWFLSYYEEDFLCQSSCDRASRSWFAAPLWNKFELQFRHTAPPPV